MKFTFRTIQIFWFRFFHTCFFVLRLGHFCNRSTANLGLNPFRACLIVHDAPLRTALSKVGVLAMGGNGSPGKNRHAEQTLTMLSYAPGSLMLTSTRQKFPTATLDSRRIITSLLNVRGLGSGPSISPMKAGGKPDSSFVHATELQPMAVGGGQCAAGGGGEC